MKRPMLFLAGCGCESGGQTGNATPIVPAGGARVCDDRYLTLAQTPDGQLLAVPQGSNCQSFLVPVNSRSFLMFIGGKWVGTVAPVITLPLLNPAVGGANPKPDSFKYLAVGTGDPAEWRHLAAPTAGTFLLRSKDGSWELADAGSIPGINEIGQSSATATKGGMMVIVETSPNVFTLRRLNVFDKRVVVGDVDQTTGIAGYKSLPPAQALEHPLANFKSLKCYQFATTKEDGTDIAGGMEQAVSTGAGAVTDGIRMIYSPAAKRLFKAPPQTIKFTQVNTSAPSVVPPAVFANMPSGHGAGLSLNYSYGTVRIDFVISFSASENTILGIFRDGLLLQEFPSTSNLNITLFYVDETNPLGAHSYDVRWRKTTGTNTTKIEQSSLLITTLG